MRQFADSGTPPAKEAMMAEGKALVLYWTKNGNTEKMARRIHDTLQKAGMTVSIARITQELTVEYFDYNLIFLGAPVYENLSPKPVLAFLHKNRRRAGVKLLASAPEVPGVAAVPFCTYGGGHTGYHEAEPMLKHIGQYFEHEGIRPDGVTISHAFAPRFPAQAPAGGKPAVCPCVVDVLSTHLVSRHFDRLTVVDRLDGLARGAERGENPGARVRVVNPESVHRHLLGWLHAGTPQRNQGLTL
jgi:multimeric flavodoxin WrbA